MSVTLSINISRIYGEVIGIIQVENLTENSGSLSEGLEWSNIDIYFIVDIE